MLSLKYIRDNMDFVQNSLTQKKSNINLSKLLEYDDQRRNCLKEVEELRAERNKVSVSIAQLKKAGKDAQDDILAMRNVSDRIKNIELGLNKMGIKTISTADSLKIFGNPNINRKKSIEIYPKNDHRIAMSWAIFALINGIKIKINNFETVDTSFPGFVALIKKIGGKIETN